MGELTLVTFNTHYGLRPPRERAEPYDLAGVLRDLGGDVLVIQEAWRPDSVRGLVDEFAAGHGYTVFYVPTGRASCRGRWPHHHPDGEGTVGTAVLTRLPGRLVGELQVGPTPGDPAPARALPWVEVDAGGDPLRLVGVHLTSRLPHGPPLQLRRLAGLVVESECPTVIAGDCNFWGPGVVTLLGGRWQRVVRGRTWPARRPHSQIDHVLVRPGRVAAHDAEIVGDVGSDHRPVRVRLTW